MYNFYQNDSKYSLTRASKIVDRCSKIFSNYLNDNDAEQLAYLICDTVTDAHGNMAESQEQFALDRCKFVAYLLKAGVQLNFSNSDSIENIFGMDDWAADEPVTMHKSYKDNYINPTPEDRSPTQFLQIDDWPLLFWEKRKHPKDSDSGATIIDVPLFNKEPHNIIVIPGLEPDDTEIRTIISETLGYAAFGYLYNVIGSLTVENGFIHGILTNEGLKLNEQ